MTKGKDKKKDNKKDKENAKHLRQFLGSKVGAPPTLFVHCGVAGQLAARPDRIPRNKFDAIEWKVEYGRLQLDKLRAMKKDMVRPLAANQHEKGNVLGPSRPEFASGCTS